MLNVYNSINYKNQNVETAYMPMDRGVNREDMVHTYSVIVQWLGCIRLCNPMLQHARLPYPSSVPGAYSNSCP